MKVGTKSVLFGAHCFFLHPFFLAASWTRLYGFPFDLRLWVAFFVHDLGYWGKPNMDGAEGELHPKLGANIMHFLFDGYDTIYNRCGVYEISTYIKRGWKIKSNKGRDFVLYKKQRKFTWHDFCLYHSRFLAKKDGKKFSKLCVADKYAIALTPYWLYLPMVNATGEIKEYMAMSAARHEGARYNRMKIPTKSQKDWYIKLQEYMIKWVNEHKDMRDDTWTPEFKKTDNQEGVWS